MAKFADYSEDTTPADGDLILTKDVSATATKKVTLLNLIKALVSYVSSFTAASTPLSGSELVAVSQSGNPRKTTVQDIADLASGGGGTTINATDGVMPYRSSSTAFSDSPLTRTNSTTVTSAAHLLFGTDNTYDIGASAASRPKDIYAAGVIRAASEVQSSTGFRPVVFGVYYGVPSNVRMVINSGDISFYNGSDVLMLRMPNAATLQFGGTTSSFPELKRSGANLEVKLADDSAYTRLGANGVNLQGVTIASLPATPAAGMTAYVTDGDAGLAWGATVVNSGGGATKYLVWYNGSNWTVSGK